MKYATSRQSSHVGNRLAALGFTVARQQDLPPPGRSILQRDGSENNTYNASWRSGPVAGGGSGSGRLRGYGRHGGSKARRRRTSSRGVLAGHLRRPASAAAVVVAAQLPRRAAPGRPHLAIDMTSPAAQAVFAVASGALGLLFVLLGQRVWRAFLALSAPSPRGSSPSICSYTTSRRCRCGRRGHRRPRRARRRAPSSSLWLAACLLRRRRLPAHLGHPARSHLGVLTTPRLANLT